jgi:CRP-like cAMP-binding protein
MVMTLSMARSDVSELPQAFFALESLGADAAPVTLNDYLGKFQSFGARRLYVRGEQIFGEGDPADTVYKIVSGAVRLCRYTPDGRRHITDFALPGDLIGFLECADQPATGEAVAETTLIAYPRAAFDRIATNDPVLRARILCHLSSTLLEAQRHLFVLGCQNAKERVASFLLRLSDRLDALQGDRIDMPMGRQDIADHLGLTIETVCRAISALKCDGALSVPNAHQLVLTDMPMLRTLAIES